MASTPDTNQYDGSTPLLPRVIVNDASIVTEPTKTNPKKNGRITREFLIKFEFNTSDNNKSVLVLLYHCQILCSILNAHNDSIIFYDKHDQVVDQAKLNTIQSNADHATLFNVYSRPSTDTRKT